MKLRERHLKILRYLSVVDDFYKTIRHIKKKIELDYSYTCLTLREMQQEGLLLRFEKNKARNAVVYEITNKGRKEIQE